jgi:ferric-dicitrate binding protein FerR (iron transport regulator)
MDRPEDRRGTDPQGRVDETIGALVRLAGPRPPVPEESALRVRAAVHAGWRRKVRARHARSVLMWGGALATAASLSLLLVSRPSGTRETKPLPIVARLERLTGMASQVRSDGTRAALLSSGQTVSAGSVLETGPTGRAALRLAGGSSLRMDVSTRFHLRSATELDLERGAVYLDSDPRRMEGDAVAIRTPHGLVRERGTQFETRLVSGTLRLRVREGHVGLEREAGPVGAAAGEELEIKAGQVSRSRVSLQGRAWDWVLQIAPGIELEGATLSDFLDWVARETHRPIRFEDVRAASSAASIRLHGSVNGMTPEEALAAVLPTCGFAHRSSGREVVLVRRP